MTNNQKNVFLQRGIDYDLFKAPEGEGCSGWLWTGLGLYSNLVMPYTAKPWSTEAEAEDDARNVLANSHKQQKDKSFFCALAFLLFYGVVVIPLLLAPPKAFENYTDSVLDPLREKLDTQGRP